MNEIARRGGIYNMSEGKERKNQRGNEENE
jgi:hypothetical protein